jgi:hypothetical protein
MSEWVVYWLHDEHCIRVQEHGYVGISAAFMTRLSVHQRDKRFPEDFEWSIIFTGSKAECLTLEHTLRPQSGIGWNRARGGKPEFTDEVRANMRKTKRTREQIEAHRLATPESRRSGAWRDKLAAASTGQVRSLAARLTQSAATRGKPKSAAHRAAISEATKRRYLKSTEREKTALSVKTAKAALRAERRSRDHANFIF